MFDIHGIDRLTVWKQFRNDLEVSPKPLEDTAILWSKAPFVSNRLPLDPSSWPDPWKLIIDGEFDSLGIVLGMLYTLQLTDRFKSAHFEIHTYQLNKNIEFVLVVDNQALNWIPRTHVSFDHLTDQARFTKVWTSN